MAKPRTPRRNPGLSKEIIMEVATEFFEREGYHGTSLDDVAKRLKVTRQAFYYYYQGKQDLLWDINRVAERHLLDAAGEILERGLDPLPRLEALLRSHTLVMARHSVVVSCFFSEERSLSPARRRAVHKSRRRYTEQLAEVYGEALADGLVEDMPPELGAYLLLGSCNDVSRWYRRDGSWSPEEIADAQVRILMRGVTTTAGRRSLARARP